MKSEGTRGEERGEREGRRGALGRLFGLFERAQRPGPGPAPAEYSVVLAGSAGQGRRGPVVHAGLGHRSVVGPSRSGVCRALRATLLEWGGDVVCAGGRARDLMDEVGAARPGRITHVDLISGAGAWDPLPDAQHVWRGGDRRGARELALGAARAAGAGIDASTPTGARALRLLESAALDALAGSAPATLGRAREAILLAAEAGACAKLALAALAPWEGALAPGGELGGLGEGSEGPLALFATSSPCDWERAYPIARTLLALAGARPAGGGARARPLLVIADQLPRLAREPGIAEQMRRCAGWGVSWMITSCAPDPEWGPATRAPEWAEASVTYSALGHGAVVVLPGTGALEARALEPKWRPRAL